MCCNKPITLRHTCMPFNNVEFQACPPPHSSLLNVLFFCVIFFVTVTAHVKCVKEYCTLSNDSKQLLVAKMFKFSRQRFHLQRHCSLNCSLRRDGVAVIAAAVAVTIQHCCFNIISKDALIFTFMTFGQPLFDLYASDR